MIPYEYPDIFTGTAIQKELLITDGTVTVTDDEYTVTDDTITFETGELETESFELSQSLMSEMQFTYGCCETGKVRFIARKHYVNSIKGVELKVYIIPNHEASKMLQLGVFKVYEDKQSDNYNVHSITAYDAMYEILNADVTDWYNTVLPSENSTETLENFRTSFVTQFGLTTESASEPLYNDDLIISRTIEKDRISGAEIIKAICELNGCFGVINNVGEFRYKGLPPSIIHDASTLELDVPDYMDIQFEEMSFKAIKKVKIVNENVTATSSQAATGNYNTYTIAYNPLIADYSQAQLQSLADDLCDLFYNHSYLPCTINAIGNPVHEVGDCLIVNTKYGFGVLTYIFERSLKGIQALRDTYRSNGVEYLSDNLNKQSTQTKAVQSQVSQMAQAYANSDTDFVETIRNIGFRLLDEPSDVSAEFDDNKVKLKWTDPNDISALEPVPCTWAGTVVVRKEGSPPRHRWDGTLITDSTTKNAYSFTALEDDAVDEDTTYCYGIFPYHIALDDANNPIKHYRFTKSISVTVGKKTIKVKDKWVAKTWQGLTSFNGTDVWSDGENTYYSNWSPHYVLNKETSTWSSKSWSGMSSFRGYFIWKYGNTTCYSESTDQKSLNKNTGTWENKIWGDSNKPNNGLKIWSDGSNYFYSDGNTQYQLDGVSETWSSKQWANNKIPYNGSYIWTDGEHLYYSAGDTAQYVYDPNTGAWSNKTWNGGVKPGGEYIWTDGTNIYYSYGQNQYVLDRSTDTWEVKEWKGTLTSFDGNCVWTDGTDIYYSKGSTQYVLVALEDD